MRILNRPMFRYGGPIKEGVMHGMRNNYQSGQLVRPGPGRPGYQGEGFWQKFLANYTPKNLTPKKIFSRLNPFSPKKVKALKHIKPAAQNLQGIFVRKATSPGITGSGAGQTFMKNLKDFSMTTPSWLRTAGTKAKDLYTRAPKKSIIGTGVAAPYAIDLAKKIPWEGVGNIIKAPYEKWKDVLGIEDKVEDKDGTDTLTEKIITETGVPGGGDRDMKYTDPEAAAKLAKDAQNKRLKSYLDMMGYDSAKKGALSDALIDASALTQDATTEAGSLKKADWGKLINKMIQTTSKRLDKPAQIREAVGLMMTKGAIEKDIAEGKQNPLDQKVTTLMNNLGYDKATATRVASGLAKDLREQVIADMGVSKQNLTHSSLTSSVKKWYPEAVSLMDTTEVKKKLGDQSAEDFITDKIKLDPSAGEGIYIIGKEVVKVDGKGNTSTIFP